MFNIFADDGIVTFIKQHSMAVIATVDGNSQPSTSTIYYAITKNDEVFFITKSQTAKFENLKLNNKAAMTIVDPQKPIALNMMGHAEEIVDPSKRDKALQMIFKLSYEHLHDFAPIIKLHKGSFAAFKFIPSDAKLTDFTKTIGTVHEDVKHFKA